jgi:hypothetical protein
MSYPHTQSAQDSRSHDPVTEQHSTILKPSTRDFDTVSLLSGSSDQQGDPSRVSMLSSSADDRFSTAAHRAASARGLTPEQAPARGSSQRSSMTSNRARTTLNPHENGPPTFTSLDATFTEGLESNEGTDPAAPPKGLHGRSSFDSLELDAAPEGGDSAFMVRYGENSPGSPQSILTGGGSAASFDSYEEPGEPPSRPSADESRSGAVALHVDISRADASWSQGPTAPENFASQAPELPTPSNTGKRSRCKDRVKADLRKLRDYARSK